MEFKAKTPFRQINWTRKRDVHSQVKHDRQCSSAILVEIKKDFNAFEFKISAKQKMVTSVKLKTKIILS